MSLSHYFLDELVFLRQKGREFSAVHPELSRFLSEHNSDPDVERLLEGFAFLTGKLRAKIEDEFPELTHDLLAMLWPNYLRPVPSMTIIQFSVVNSALTRPTLISRGCQLDSLPIDGVSCHFRTCYDAWIYPARAGNVQSGSDNDHFSITLPIDLHVPLSLGELQLDKLRFFLGGDQHNAYELYFWLANRLAFIELEVEDIRYRQPASMLKPVGFERDDAILPYPSNVYSGYRILQEYFCFPESFLFFELSEGGWPQQLKKISQFKLHFHFAHPMPVSLKIRDDSLMLNCVPAINLFSHDSEPINLTGQKTDYPLRCSNSHTQSVEIFSVDQVDGWIEELTGRTRGMLRIYQPFESFQHQIERTQQRQALYYRLRVRENMLGNGFDHGISFVRGDETQVIDLDESISVRLTCTNRDLAARLKVGEICVPTGNSPSFASFRNLTRPTQSLRPVLDASLHWTLISNLSLNYLSILQRDAVVQILRVYDFPALHDKQSELASRKRLAGIESIESQPIDRLMRGMPVRGIKTVLSVYGSAFGGDGQLYLFSSVLAHFFSLYASVNSFHLLEVVNLDNKERYTWPAQLGQHSLM